MTMKNNKNKIGQTIAFAVAGVLLASFMGSMGMAQEATAAGHLKDRGVYFWHSGLCSTGAPGCATILQETLNAESGGTSNLIFHYSGTQTPTTLQIDTMKDAVDSGQFECSQVGMQGTSLAQLEDLADVVQAEFKTGYSCGAQPWLGYNLENNLSPAGEVADPVGSFQDAKAIAVAHGLRLLAAPANSMLNSNPQAGDIANTAGIVIVNVAGAQDADCTEARDEVIDNVDRIRSVSPSEVIVFQVSLTRAGADVAMMETCFDEIIPTAVSGFTVWTGTASRDNGDFETAMAYGEDNFPSV